MKAVPALSISARHGPFMLERIGNTLRDHLNIWYFMPMSSKTSLW